MPGIVQFSPPILEIGLDSRPVFGQRQPESDIAIEVAVGEMMDDVPDRPSAGTIWGFKLLGRQSLDRRTKHGRGCVNLIDQRLSLRLGQRPVILERADGVAQVHRLASYLGLHAEMR